MSVSYQWPGAQLKVLRENIHLTDAELADLLATVGRVRTVKAIKTQRLSLGLAKRANGSGGRIDRLQRKEAALRYLEGWPVLRGTPEERDRKYVAMLARALIRQRAA